MPLLLTYGPQLSVKATGAPVNIGEAGVLTFVAQGADGPVTWTLLASDFPAEWDAALNVSGDTATLTTAAAETPGTFAATVTAVDTSRQPVSATGRVRVVAAPITIDFVPSGPWLTGEAVPQEFTVSGGSGVYVAARLRSGTLPDGVTGFAVSGSTVTVLGTPTTLGFGAFAIEVEDSDGGIGAVAYSWEVYDPVVVNFIPATPWIVGEAVPQTFTVTGGTGVYVDARVGTGALPAGVTGFDIDGDTVSVLGTPTTPGSGAFSLEVEDSAGIVGVVAYSWDVEYEALVITGTFPASFTTGAAVDETLPITGGTGTYSSIAVQTGALPPGLSLSISGGTNARLSGTIGDVGATFAFTFRVTDSAANTGDSAAQSIEITGTLWTPADLSAAPKVWIDWNSSVTNVSGFASAWSNSQGSIGGSFDQSSSGARPQILSAELNGKRVIRFDGTDDWMRMATSGSGDLFRNVSAGWSFSVLKKRTVDVSVVVRVVFTSAGGTGATRFAPYLYQSIANTHALVCRRLDADSAGVLNDGGTGTGWNLRIDMMEWGNGDAEIVVNGVSAATNGSLTSSGNTSNTAASSNRLTLGGDGQNTAQQNPDMDLAVLLIGSGSSMPSSTEFRKIEGWAAGQLGLSGNLDSAHPYKLGPPVKP